MSSEINSSFSWYILTVIPGNEKKVKEKIELIKSNSSNNSLAFLEEIIVPVEKVFTRTKKGEGIFKEKLLAPGYVIVKVSNSDFGRDAIISIINSVSEVKKHLGPKAFPVAVSENEISSFLTQVDSKSSDSTLSSEYIIGTKVKILEGPFNGFTGVVKFVDIDNKKLDVSIAIFGRYHPIKISFFGVEKI